MTETEWNKCNDINKMLNFVKDERKKRLFGCACVRQIWHLLEDDRSKQAIIVSEQYADGLVSKEKLDEARSAAWSAYDVAYTAAAAAAAADVARSTTTAAAWYSATAAYAACYVSAYAASAYAAAAYAASAYAAAANVAAAAAKVLVTTYIPLLKDIFDPFNKYKQPHCNNYTKQFTRTIYENPNKKGELLDLHVLADMLIDQDVDQVLIDHLRNGVHFRGCQVIDLILEKK